MYVFNSEMHVLTLVVCIFEFGMFSYQLVHYLSRPQDKQRLWYLILLGLLIVYNVSGGLLPDPRWSVPIVLQNIVAYGCGFLMSAYFPFYFFVTFKLRRLRFHALRGVWLFLILPYVVFFWLVYPVTGRLDLATSYGMLVPAVYAFVILYALLDAIRGRIAERQLSGYPYSKPEMFWVYAAVSPWAAMTAVVYFHIEQWIEVLISNLGFLIITVLFIARTVRTERAREVASEMAYVSGDSASVFERNCVLYGLTKREVEIALLISQGKQYKYIADELFISLDTVKSHVKNIFKKLEVGDKTEMVYKLGKETN